MDRTSFLMSDLCQAFDIKQRTFLYWNNLKIIEADQKKRPPRLYSPRESLIIGLIHTLVEKAGYDAIKSVHIARLSLAGFLMLKKNYPNIDSSKIELHVQESVLGYFVHPTETIKTPLLIFNGNVTQDEESTILFKDSDILYLFKYQNIINNLLDKLSLNLDQINNMIYSNDDKVLQNYVGKNKDICLMTLK